MSHGTNPEVRELIDSLFRKEYGKIVSFLVSKFGLNFFDTANDIVQETLMSALQSWSENHVPENPEGWLFRVARNKAINYLKRENKNQNFREYHAAIEDSTNHRVILQKEIEDSMLKMIFACCTDLISIESQIVLILSVLGGFSRKEIANALVTEEETIKKRLYRAKKILRESNWNVNVTDYRTLKNRLTGVSNSLYLLFNEGYNSSSNDALIRKDICLEALRLAQLLTQYFENDTRVRALLSLMCFHIARFDSRIDTNGAIILFKNQNRSLWNQKLIAKGINELAVASEGNEMSVYHLEAGIALQHCIAKSYQDTNWLEIKKLYLLLDKVKISPIIRLNLAIVEGIIEGPYKAIEALEHLRKKSKRLSKYYLLYASLGEFYKELGKPHIAKENFQKAISLTSSSKEKELLLKKIGAINF